MHRQLLVVGVAFVCAFTTAANAEVLEWRIASHEPYAAGKPIGEVGPCERLSGRIHFALDPANETNKQIVDLKLAPKNAQGKVDFWADFVMLVPVDRSKLNGALFYEVNNPRQSDGAAAGGWRRGRFPAAARFYLSLDLAGSRNSCRGAVASQ
jgi:hypothetical protein